MIKKLFSLSCAALLCAAPLAPAQNADELLAAVRKMTVSQGERDVQGHIRKGRTKTPFSLSARGKTLVFQYKAGSAWQRFDVRIADKKADLLHVKGSKATVMPASDYTKPIAASDVCYEDLSLRFLYWKNGKLLNEPAASRIKGRDCYIVQVPNPQPNLGQFAWVRIWIDKENGTTWQIDGYGKDGKLKKRFSITSVQKLKDGNWFFKQMKLEVRSPQDSSRTIALNYIEMKDLDNKK